MKIHLTLERKLSLILLLFFFSMLLVVAVLLGMLRSEYDARVYAINDENTRNVMMSADSAFAATMMTGDYIVSDDFFQSTLSSLKDGKGDAAALEGDIRSRLSTMIEPLSYIIDITLMRGSWMVGYGAGLGLSSDSAAEASRIAREAGGAAVWVGSDDGCIYLVRTIRRLEFLSLDELAVLFIRIDATALADSLTAGSPDRVSYLMISNGSRLLYSEYPGSLSHPDASSIGMQIDGRPYFIYRGTLPRSGFDYVDVVLRDSLYDGMVQLVGGAFFLFLVMLLAFLLLLHHIVRRMIARINALREKMDAFEQGGSLEGISSLPGDDEIAQLNDRFDRMAKEYRDVVEDSYSRELMLKDSEIRMLTQQINPHFLYNVLDSIYWMSQKYQADDIAAMSYDLAALFRAAVSAEDLVPVSRELELLESFLGIQRRRFPDSISYSVEADGDSIGALLPKFSLQPLVENAIKHSVEEKGARTDIIVSCRRRGDDIILEVSNTGSAFPDGLADMLRSGMVSSSTQRIGLQNIDERLHLLFGEGHGLEFRNEDGRAIVSFSVPGRYDA